MFVGEVIVSMISVPSTEYNLDIKADIPSDWDAQLVTDVTPDEDLIADPATATMIVSNQPEQFFIDLGGDCLWYMDEAEYQP